MLVLTVNPKDPKSNNIILHNEDTGEIYATVKAYINNPGQIRFSFDAPPHVCIDRLKIFNRKKNNENVGE